MSRLESFVKLLSDVADEEVLIRLYHKLDELPDYILDDIVENLLVNSSLDIE